jgi:hypothetical protein
MTIRLLIRQDDQVPVDFSFYSTNREYEIQGSLLNGDPQDDYPELVTALFRLFPEGCWIVASAVFEGQPDESDIHEYEPPLKVMH